ncbi:replication initiator protein A [Deinococcus radiophilus]|uniref:Plasmid replication initiator protein n=1 Tax=Deinococcus radiophilus TaxID=32062 RepID=A0A3S0I4V7_9DEIO|nr:replication initiator protein A [Deinococcus radiophilus]RTR25204.1 hypothetical protein EJ104_11940 [Deinococcus radiophilus]UFA51830.1 replication initiator protein A [Deinococcus radiophilus]
MTGNESIQKERRDERNVARLGIISIQSRIDEQASNWQAEFSIEGRPYRVECAAPYGRPHGVDTDIILAIQTLFFRSGCPTHNWLHTTAYELRSVSGLADNGRTYQRLKDSLKRLWGTGFVVGEGWYDGAKQRQMWSSDTLRYIERIKFHEVDGAPEDLPGLEPNSTLSIRLGEQLANSLRARQVQVLDGELLIQLEQPPARALYRLLEAHRIGEDGERRMELEVNLPDWRHACGIQSDRPEIIRRALTPAHDELKAIHYLEDVEIEGRGQKQTFKYHFAVDNAPDPALIELLLGTGFTRSRAAELAGQYPDRIEQAVAFVRERQQAGKVKNPAGLVMDFLRHQDKYPATDLPPGVPDADTRAIRAIQAIQIAEAQAEQEARREREELARLSPADQFSRLKSTFKLMLKPLGKDALVLFEKKCSAGELVPVEVREQASTAMAEARFQEFLEGLGKQLRE